MNAKLTAALIALDNAAPSFSRGIVCSRDEQLDDSREHGLNAYLLGQLRNLGLAQKDHFGEWTPTVLAGWVLAHGYEEGVALYEQRVAENRKG